MSTEAQVAMLMLRLLIDKPQELKKVLDYLQSEVLLRKAVLEVGKGKVASREEILGEFEDRFGLVVDFIDDESVNDPMTTKPAESSGKMIGLPSGVMFRAG